jgi:hypothetical protein
MAVSSTWQASDDALSCSVMGIYIFFPEEYPICHPVFHMGTSV